MKLGPPANPQEGDAWSVYRFQRGKGWVDKHLYEPEVAIKDCAEPPPPGRDFTSFGFELEVKTATTESLFRYAKASGFTPVELLAKVVGQVLERDLFAKVLCAHPERALPPLKDGQPKGHVNLKLKSAHMALLVERQAASPGLTMAQAAREIFELGVAALNAPPPLEPEKRACTECGGPVSATSSTGRCRACYFASKRKPKVALTCEDCGKPRSIGSGARCRACYSHNRAVREAEARDRRQPKPVTRVAEPVKAPPAPAPVAAPQSLAQHRFEAPRPEIPAPALQIPVDETVEISVPKSVKRPPDPFAPKPKPHVTAPAGPGFSPEFLEKMKRVAEGAGIAVVQKVPGRFVEGGSGSSLGDIA